MIKILLGLAALFALDLFLAQATVFALSVYGVHSGIWGPFILEGVAGSIIAYGVSLGVAVSK